MSAANPWAQLLEVQQHDTTIDQLEHRRGSLPERDQLDQLQVERTGLAAETDARQRRRDELSRSQKRLEDEIVMLGTRREQTNTTLYGGGVNSPKELGALQDEISSIDRRIKSLEDEILEIMELVEPVEADLTSLAKRAEELEQREVDLQASLTEAETDIVAELAQARSQRLASLDGVDETLLTQYESARKRLGGVAVARLSGGKCDGCHLSLSAVEVDRIKHMALDEPYACEECGRFLVR